METNCYQVLLVGNIKPDSFFTQKPVPDAAGNLIQYMQVPSYLSAVRLIQQELWDAVFVVREFDGHTGLEFIHHSRLLASQAPIVLLCEDFDAGLDYKARRIGAADCIAMEWLNSTYLNDLFLQQRNSPSQEKRKTMKTGFFEVMGAFLTS